MAVPASPGMPTLAIETLAPTSDDIVAEKQSMIVEPTEALKRWNSQEGSLGANHPTGFKLQLAFLSLIMCILLAGLDGNIIATAVPAITDHFHTVEDVGWYFTAYRLSACSLQFLFGKLYTMYPTKRLFLVSEVIFLFGSVLCATAVTSPMLVIGRAVTGVGLSGGAAGFFSIITEVVPPRQRPLFGGVFGAVETLSGILAPVLGGVITQHLNWRWVFWINLPIGGAAVLTMAFFLPETAKQAVTPRTWRQTIRELDILGSLLLLSSLTALFIALNWGGITYPWSDPRIIALLVVFAVLSLALIIHQVLRKGTGILPLRIMGNRNILGGVIFVIGAGSALSIQEYYAPAYFQAIRGYSPTHSGYMMFPCLVGTLVGILVQGPGTSLIGYYMPFMVASSILLPIGAGLMTTWGPESSLSKLVTYLALAGFAAGLGFQCPQNAASTALPKEDVPLGIAAVLFAQSFGPALFVSIAQAIFTNRLSDNLVHQMPHANVTLIEDLGLTEVQRVFRGEDLEHVVLAYSKSISQTWYFATGVTCLSIVGTLMMQWLSIETEHEEGDHQARDDEKHEG